MTTIAEQQGTVAGLLDKIVNNLTGFADWSEVDNGFVQNDQTAKAEADLPQSDINIDNSDGHNRAKELHPDWAWQPNKENWHNNARLVQHAPSGYHYLFALTGSGIDSALGGNNGGGQNHGGIAILRWEGYDTTNKVPQGQIDHTVNRNGNYRRSIYSTRTQSNDVDYWVNNDASIEQADFEYGNNNEHFIKVYPGEGDNPRGGASCPRRQQADSAGWDARQYSNQGDTMGLYFFYNGGGYPSDLATKNVTYFASFRNDGFSLAAWNTTDSQNGSAGIYSWHHVDTTEKFWSDGNSGVQAMCQTTGTHDTNRYDDSANVAGMATYGGNVIGSDGVFNTYYASAPGFGDRANWGTVNPDANDDTFFFRYGLMYVNSNQEIPAAYFDEVLPNDITEGAAHSDTITFDGKTYRIIKQRGSGSNLNSKGPISVAIRYD